MIFETCMGTYKLLAIIQQAKTNLIHGMSKESVFFELNRKTLEIWEINVR